MCYRASVVVLLALATACLTCSSLFPLFRASADTWTNLSQKSTYYYWYLETSSAMGSGTWSVTRTYTRDLACTRMRLFYVVSSALSTAAAGLGGLATLLAATWVSRGYSVCLGVMNFVLTLLAFACSAVVVGLMSYAYCRSFCGDDALFGTVATLHESGYRPVEGYILLVVGTFLLLVLVIVQAIGFCCGCQVGRRASSGASHEGAREPVDSRDSQDAPKTVDVDASNSADAPDRA